MSTTLSPEQHDTLARTLDAWGVAPEDVGAILAHGSFPPAVVGIEPIAGGPAGIGILIETSVDPELGWLLAWRERLSDERLAHTPHVSTVEMSVIHCPFAPEAMLTVAVALTQPRPIQRTFLLLMSKRPKVYRLLAQGGAAIWLLPSEVAIRHWASEGIAHPDELYDHAIPIAQTEHGSPTILAALDHITHTPNRRPR